MNTTTPLFPSAQCIQNRTSILSTDKSNDDSWLRIGASYEQVVVSDQNNPSIKNNKMNEIEAKIDSKPRKDHKKSRKIKKAKHTKVKNSRHQSLSKLGKNEASRQLLNISSDFSESESDKDENSDYQLRSGEEIIYLPNGTMIISNAVETTSSTTFQINRIPDYSLKLYQSTPLADVPFYDLHQKNKTISSEKLAQAAYQLPSGIVQEKDIKKKVAIEQSLSKSKRYYSSEAYLSNSSLNIKRRRYNIIRKAKEASTSNYPSSSDMITSSILPLPPVIERKDGHGEQEEIDDTLQSDSQIYGQEALSLSKHYNSAVRERPGNIIDWLILAQLQDMIIHYQKLSNGMKMPSLTTPTTFRWAKGNVEKKVSVLEECLRQQQQQQQLQQDANRSNISEVYLTLLHYYYSIYDEENLLIFLEKAIENCPNNFEIFIKRLYFFRIHFEKVNASQLRLTYWESFNKKISEFKNKMAALKLSQEMASYFTSSFVPIHAIPHGSSIITSTCPSITTTTTTTTTSNNSDDNNNLMLLSTSVLFQIKVLFEYLLLEKAMGYVEKMIAIIQAMFDINIISKQTHQYDTIHQFNSINTFDQLLLLYEQYWDSEYIRPGEPVFSSTATTCTAASHLSNTTSSSNISTSNSGSQYNYEEFSTLQILQLNSQSSGLNAWLLDDSKKHLNNNNNNNSSNNNNNNNSTMRTLCNGSLGFGFDSYFNMTARITPNIDDDNNNDIYDIYDNNGSNRNSNSNNIVVEQNATRIISENSSINNVSKTLSNKNSFISATTTNIGSHTQIEEFNNIKDNNNDADDDDDNNNNEDPDTNASFVYSHLHGYRIKVIEEEDTGLAYKKILHELKELEGQEDLSELSPEEILKKYSSNSTTQKQRYSNKFKYPEPNKNDKYLLRFENEDYLSKTQWRPLRILNEQDKEEAESQPDRVVLFDDIKTWLFEIPSIISISSPLKSRMTIQLLQSLGLFFPNYQCSHAEENRLLPHSLSTLSSWTPVQFAFKDLIDLCDSNTTTTSSIESTNNNNDTLTEVEKCYHQSIILLSTFNNLVLLSQNIIDNYNQNMTTHQDTLLDFSIRLLTALLFSKNKTTNNENILNYKLFLELQSVLLILLTQKYILSENIIRNRYIEQSSLSNENQQSQSQSPPLDGILKEAKKEWRNNIRNLIQFWEEERMTSSVTSHSTTTTNNNLDMSVWVTAVTIELSVNDVKEGTKVCGRALTALHSALHTSSPPPRSSRSSEPIYFKTLCNIPGALELHWLQLRLKLQLPIGYSSSPFSSSMTPSDNIVINSYNLKNNWKKYRKQWSTSLDIICMLIEGQLPATTSGKKKSIEIKVVSKQISKLEIYAMELFNTWHQKNTNDAMNSNNNEINILTSIDTTPDFYYTISILIWSVFLSSILTNSTDSELSNNTILNAILETEKTLKSFLKNSNQYSNINVLYYCINSQFPFFMNENGSMSGTINNNLKNIENSDNSSNIMMNGSLMVGLERLHNTRLEFLLFVVPMLSPGSLSHLQLLQSAARDALYASPLNSAFQRVVMFIEGMLPGGYIRLKSYLKCLRHRVNWSTGLMAAEMIMEILLEIQFINKKHSNEQLLFSDSKVSASNTFQNDITTTTTSTVITNNMRWKKEDFLRIQNIFETAFQDPIVRNIPLVWNLYLKVSIKCEMYENANRIYFRALQYCAWCKELWILALGPLRRCFNVSELEGILTVIREKNFHLRTE